MIIQCDRCQTTYDFPDHRVKPGGMRAKCAECGHVMHITKDSALDAVPPDADVRTAADSNEMPLSGPAGSGERPPSGGTGDSFDVPMLGGAKPQAPIDAPPPKRRRPTNQPSVIVDIDGLNDPDEVAAAQQAAATQAAFDPLAGIESPATLTNDRHRTRMPVFDGPEPSGIQEIKPPSFARWAVLGLIVIVGGFWAYVGFALNWDPIWYQDPFTAVKRVVGFEKAPAPIVAPPPKVVEAPVTGRLEVADVQMSLLKTGKRRHLAAIQGVVRNDSNRLHHSIRLKADLIDTDTNLTVATRKADCCAQFDDATAKTVAAEAEHPHFSEKPGGEGLRLAPGESIPFTVLLRDLGDDIDRKPVAPEVMIHFSETEKVP